MIFHFILEIAVKKMLFLMFKASALFKVIELRFLFKDVWSVMISFFLAFLGIYLIRQKISYISLVYRKSVFIMGLILNTNAKIETAPSCFLLCFFETPTRKVSEKY